MGKPEWVDFKLDVIMYRWEERPAGWLNLFHDRYDDTDEVSIIAREICRQFRFRPNHINVMATAEIRNFVCEEVKMSIESFDECLAIFVGHVPDAQGFEPWLVRCFGPLPEFTQWRATKGETNGKL